MTRPLATIEVDLQRAQDAWQAATDAHRAAVATANALRQAAIAGDSSVTAVALAEAEHAAEFAQLPIRAKQAAVEALEAEALVARTEAFADQVNITIPPLRASVEQTLAEIDALFDKLVSSWRAHADAVQQAAFLVQAGTVSDKVSPRVTGGILHGVIVDGNRLSVLEVHEPLAKMTNRVHQRLFARRPGPQN